MFPFLPYLCRTGAARRSLPHTFNQVPSRSASVKRSLPGSADMFSLLNFCPLFPTHGAQFYHKTILETVLEGR